MKKNKNRLLITGAVMTLIATASYALEPRKSVTPRISGTVVAASEGQYTVKEGWDKTTAQANGWNALGKTQQTYHATGGNPGGHLELWSSITQAQTSKRSEQLTGNFLEKGVNQFQVDLRSSWTSTSSAKPKSPAIYVRGNVSKDAWILPMDDFSFRNTQWQTVTASFDPRWTDQQAIANGWEPPRENYYISFRDTMKSVVYLAIYVNASKSTKPMFVDNFIVRGKRGGYSAKEALDKPVIRARPLNTAPTGVAPRKMP